MFRPIARLSRLLSHLRWLYMPAGLFALLAVGIHAGAAAIHDPLLVGLDGLDGLADRAAAQAFSAIGGLLGAQPDTVDRWIASAARLVDLQEREMLAGWLSVFLELGADFVLALPALGYRERQAEELARTNERQARLAELVAQKLEQRHPGARPVPAQGSLQTMLRSALFDPTLLRTFLPLATAAAAVAGACRIATEMQAISFGGLSRLLEPGLAGSIGRALALFVLGAVVVCLGLRAVLQSLWWAHRRAEDDRLAGRPAHRRRLRGWLRLSVAGPLAAAAAVYGAPVLSFFR
ncbi:MAG: hypothetical protein HY901_25130 [Deltaproteobacteria bacterium]|nr:hypothetical protein [Deltaproteobacteria bacterium]